MGLLAIIALFMHGWQIVPPSFNIGDLQLGHTTDRSSTFGLVATHVMHLASTPLFFSFLL